MDFKAPCSLTTTNCGRPHYPSHACEKQKQSKTRSSIESSAGNSGPALKSVWSETLLPGGACQTGYTRPDLWEKGAGQRLESGARTARRKIGGSSQAQGAGRVQGQRKKSRPARPGLRAPPPPRRKPSPPTSPRLPRRRSSQSCACSRRYRPQHTAGLHFP